MLANALVSCCSIRWGDIRVEVTMPSDFLLTFANTDDCTWVLFIDNFSCRGARLSFRHWNRLVHAGSDKLRYLTKATNPSMLPKELQIEVSERDVLPQPAPLEDDVDPKVLEDMVDVEGVFGH
ncbi:hypothetical protein E2562_010820 [Oryza meyeriana var. granulata]|uniref:DUF4283 domain-containing protein n=1 Tax=Oryza meyeriana var. granulata TaxID=110450 RepID=A0A6G1BK73_9ORYZ|nr:hypothetical protein E2562_010820 [Oryza meyeriana var. granulata]